MFSNYPENVDEPRIIANSYSDNAFVFFGIYPLPGNDVDINTFYDQIDDQIHDGGPSDPRRLLDGALRTGARVVAGVRGCSSTRIFNRASTASRRGSAGRAL